MKKILIELLGLVLVALLLFGTFRAGLCVGRNEPRQTDIRIDTLMIVDTVRVEAPSVEVRTFVKLDTLVVVDEAEIKEAEYMRDSAMWRCAQLEWVNDSLVAVLARTQAHYHQDSLYDIWVSGVMPALDSVKVQRWTEYVIVNREYTGKASHWKFQATAGPGVICDWNGRLHAGGGICLGFGYSF